MLLEGNALSIELRGLGVFSGDSRPERLRQRLIKRFIISFEQDNGYWRHHFRSRVKVASTLTPAVWLWAQTVRSRKATVMPEKVLMVVMGEIAFFLRAFSDRKLNSGLC
jgi:hypothetical protein